MNSDVAHVRELKIESVPRKIPSSSTSMDQTMNAINLFLWSLLGGSTSYGSGSSDRLQPNHIVHTVNNYNIAAPNNSDNHT